MKSPKLQEIPEKAPSSFAERGKVAKKKAETKPKAVKLSITLHPEQLEHVNKHALKLGQQRGKSANTSEALRDIINAHRGVS